VTSKPGWLDDLRPVAEPRLEPLARGSGVLAWHATVAFRRWLSPPGAPKPAWAETYGKAQILSGDGVRSVAEIELTRRLREAGWQGGWMDTFGSAPRGWREWLVEPGALPAPVRDVMKRVAATLGTAGAGRPDLVAWRGSTLGEAVFVEYKGPSDRIRPGQDAWYRAALATGISRDQFAVARWPRVLADNSRLADQ
jgi:VRR-NUC domain